MQKQIHELVLMTMTALIDCLNLQAPLVYEEAILAAGAVMEHAGENGVPFIVETVRHILLSQISQSPSITALGAVCAGKLYRGHGQRMDGLTIEIMSAFQRNLDDDMVPMETKKRLLDAVAVIIERAGTGLSFWEFYFEELEKFTILPLTESSDQEAMLSLMAALANGYRTLITVAGEDPTIARVFQKFRLIVGLIDKIVKSQWCNLDIEKECQLEVACAVTNLVGAVLRCPIELQKRVNGLLHRQCVKQVLTDACNNFHVGEAHALVQQLSKI
jgi:hypothetical protein